MSMNVEQKSGSVLGGALLIAGTCIGGGMLGLPVVTNAGGFIPAMVIYFFCWLVMSSTGLMMAETALAIDGEPNMISMVERTLGGFGKAVCWIFYLLLFYCLTVAYITACGNIVTDALNQSVPIWLGTILFCAMVFPLFFIGTRLIDKINILMMVGLIVSFILFVAIGFPHVSTEKLLSHQNWWLSIGALPVAFASFAYQGTVPTIASYMGRDPARIKKVIVLGSLFPVVIYVIWEWLILGIVPTDGPNSLAEALQNGSTSVMPLKEALNNPQVYKIGQYFSFFALITSFFGVTLGLIDFLADGLKIKKDGKGKVIILSLIFIPPIIVSMINPHVFLVALEYAGGIGCAVLLAIFPCLMVWRVRYDWKAKIPQMVPGGRLFLFFIMTLAILEVTYQIAKTFHLTS